MGKTKVTKEDRILYHLKTRGSITSIEAVALFGVTRLSARIYDLRQKGHRIKSEKVNGVDRYGTKIWYTRYTLVAE